MVLLKGKGGVFLVLLGLLLIAGCMKSKEKVTVVSSEGETVTLESVPPEIMSPETVPLEAVSLETVPLEAVSSEDVVVHSYLWKGALQTLSKLPLHLTDPIGGVVTTEWFSLPAAPEYQQKIEVYFLGSTLTPSSLKVVVLQKKQEGNQWLLSTPSPVVATKIEEKILEEAYGLETRTILKKKKRKD